LTKAPSAPEILLLTQFGDQKMARTVADQFAEILAAAGVKRIYGMSGTA
jgi:hypothetical protein